MNSFTGNAKGEGRLRRGEEDFPIFFVEDKLSSMSLYASSAVLSTPDLSASQPVSQSACKVALNVSI